MNELEEPDSGGKGYRKKFASKKVRAAAGIALVAGTAIGGFAIAGASAATTSNRPSTATGTQGISGESQGQPSDGLNKDGGQPSPSGATGVSGATGMAGGMCAHGPGVAGTIESLGASSFTVKETSGSVVTVDVDSTTTYFDPSVTSPTLSNVTVGENVAVIGTTASGVVTATRVMIGLPGGGHGRPGGPGAGGFGGPPPSGATGS